MNIVAILYLAIAAVCGQTAGDKMKIAIIPQPVSMEIDAGTFELHPSTRLVGNAAAEPVLRYARQAMGTATGFTLPIAETPQDDFPNIIFTLKPELQTQLGKEGYRLTVTPKQVVIEAAQNNGLFYGVQTLRQLLPPDIYQDRQVRGVRWTTHCVRIADQPRFVWRGLHLDVCRHFMPKAFVKKYIDLLAMHKMNVFHWHLTEDQGWRIEIKRYPKLTEIGAWRKETIIGHARGDKALWTFDGTPHGGFYTQDDVREIVAYAAERFVTVVPEIEMPGHAQAAIAAYPELGTTGKPVEVLTYWGGCIEIFNVEDTTIAFLQNVLTEVMELFPSEFIHIGGDEVTKQPWKDDPRAQAKMAALGLKNEEELQSWFIHQMDAFLAAHGRRLVGWDEILEGGLAPGATVMSWRGQAGGIAAANAGHDVVMAPGTHTYFDKYQADPATQPLAIGGFIPLETVYAYERELSHFLGDKI